MYISNSYYNCLYDTRNVHVIKYSFSRHASLLCSTSSQMKEEKERKKKEVLQQEAYPVIWPLDARNSAILGAIPQNRRRPV